MSTTVAVLRRWLDMLPDDLEVQVSAGVADTRPIRGLHTEEHRDPVTGEIVTTSAVISESHYS